MQKFLRLIARLIVARHECTYVRHCKENTPIYMYYVALETPMMSSIIADCPDLAPPPQYFGQVYAYAQGLPTHGMMAACLRDILIYSLQHISLPVSHPNTIHHSRLNVCLIDYLDLNPCLSIVFWLRACE